MDFVTEKEDYNVAEFYGCFGHALPKMVMVKQGFLGESVEDTFAINQIIRLHAIAKQKRVVAWMERGNRKFRISIPVSYEEKLCVEHALGKRGKEKLLSTILLKHKLPLKVHFPQDKLITVGNHTISSDNIPSLELLHTFDEVSLLGNSFSDGVITRQVICAPLYLSQLRWSIITGMHEIPQQEWTDFLAQLDSYCKNLYYNPEFGNKDIAVYDPTSVHSDDTVYTYVKPTIYANIAKLVTGTPHQNRRQQHPVKELTPDVNKDDDYEPIDVTSNGRGRHNQSNVNPKTISVMKTESVASFKNAFKQSVLPFIQSGKFNLRSSRTSKSLQSDSDILAHQTYINLQNGVQPPPVPKRIPKLQTNLPLKRGQINEKIYYNDIPRLSIPPMLVDPEAVKHSVAEKPPLAKKPNVKIPCAYVNSSDTQRVNTNTQADTSVTDVTSSCYANLTFNTCAPLEQIRNFTIEDVANILKSLRLERYVDRFKEELINGNMLVSINQDVLVEEFGMRRIEALRLYQFIKDGQIPM